MSIEAGTPVETVGLSTLAYRPAVFRYGEHWQIETRDWTGWISSASNFGAETEAESEYKARAEWEHRKENGLCKECGTPIGDHWIEPINVEVVERQLCHCCLTWTKLRAKTQDDPTVVIVAGRHYMIEPEPKPWQRGFLGHGGAEFRIRFHDGREVVTHNLWSQGVIPPWFHDRIPDNAEFLKRESKPVGPLPGGGGYVGAGSADGSVIL